MMHCETLEKHVRPATYDCTRIALSDTLTAIAAACAEVADLVAAGPVAETAERTCGRNPDADQGQVLARAADRIFREAVTDMPVACLMSAATGEPLAVSPDAPLIVAIDALEGAANLATNGAAGSIFSIRPADASKRCGDTLQPGSAQLAAGYCIYGPQTLLVLTLGQGTHKFTLNRQASQFRLTEADIRIKPTSSELAIDAANFRFWETPVRTYVADCLQGQRELRCEKCNMRWFASLVAECHRILLRGGVFLYPGDRRPGCADGRLPLVYECKPIAFLVEQAGGRATTGSQRILDVQSIETDAPTPFIFGSEHEVERIERYFVDNQLRGQHAQIFTQRGLFRQ